VSLTIVSVAEITKAVQQQLTGHPLMNGVSVTRSEQITNNASECPWIGIYRARVQYPIRVLGNMGQGRYQRSNLVLVCQETSGSSGAECEDKLEALVANVLIALYDNPLLKPDDNSPGVIDYIDEIEVNYKSYTQTDNVFMQQVNLYITTVSRTN